jgi:hypothetical protein
MARQHYHVGLDTPGYSPDLDNVYMASSKRTAIAMLAAEVRRYREDEWELPRNERRTGHGSARDGYVHFSRPGDAYDLGLSFWWQPCTDTDCEDESKF